MSGHFSQAESPVEGVCPVVDREHVQDQVLTSPVGLAQERGDELGTDAASLMVGMDLDAAKVDLGGAVLDAEHADTSPVGGDDLPAVWIEPARVIVPLDLLVPPPDRGNV